MANELYIFTTPPDSTVTLALDSGEQLTAYPVPGHDNRQDGHVVPIPMERQDSQGGALTVTHDGYIRFDTRGIVVPSSTATAHFELDDIHLVPEPVPEVPPPPTTGEDPWGIINQVYASGLYDLSTKNGCGLFTEECCTQLHNRNSQAWGHIKKTGAQNQFNSHAVDALSCIAGPEYGVWDIVYSSASPAAKPVYNHAGDPNPEEWYYPAAPITQTMTTALMAPQVSPATARRIALHLLQHAIVGDILVSITIQITPVPTPVPVPTAA
jgi:hypothetical protein